MSEEPPPTEDVDNLKSGPFSVLYKAVAVSRCDAFPCLACCWLLRRVVHCVQTHEREATTLLEFGSTASNFTISLSFFLSTPIGRSIVISSICQANSQVLVNLRNNHKLLGRVKAYDRHMNL